METCHAVPVSRALAARKPRDSVTQIMFAALPLLASGGAAQSISPKRKPWVAKYSTHAHMRRSILHSVCISLLLSLVKRGSCSEII